MPSEEYFNAQRRQKEFENKLEFFRSDFKTYENLVPMKVIHFCIGKYFGGVYRLMFNLNEEYRLSGKRIEPIFVMCYDDYLADELRKRGATVEIIPPPNVERPWGSLSTLWALGRIIRKYDVKVIVCNEIWNYAIAWPVAKILSIKNILWSHTANYNIYPKLYGRLNWFRPDLTLCDSKYVHALFKEKWPDINSIHIYLPYRRPQLKKNAPVRAGDRVRFIYVGRIVAYKGLLEAVEAFGLVKNPDYEFIVVGDANNAKEAAYKERVLARCRELGLQQKVNFVGYKENVFEYLLSADVLLHPNTFPEDFGFVFLEALFAGCPIIASNIGGSKEILAAQPSKMGDLAPPGDINTLSKLLTKYIEDADYRLQVTKNVKSDLVNICDPQIFMSRFSGFLTGLAPEEEKINLSHFAEQ